MPPTVNFARVERKTLEAARSRDGENKHDYFVAVSQVRYVLRKVFRLIDEQAKKFELESLEHQALIQIYGSANQCLRVNELADRLDVAPAFASSLVKKLANRELLVRDVDPSDMRVTILRISDGGREICHRIDAEVRPHVDYFTSQLTADEREMALSFLVFYMRPSQSKDSN